jgi:hypothetical protein
VGPPGRSIPLEKNRCSPHALQIVPKDFIRPHSPSPVGVEERNGGCQGHPGIITTEARNRDLDGAKPRCARRAVPKADVVPPLDVVALDFPSARNEMGIKGVGESGVISPVPAIANAVEDALADRGVEVTHLPLTPASLWEALRGSAPTHRRPWRV